MIRRCYAALIPLFVLLGAISLACIVGYFIGLSFGDDYPLRKIIKKTTQFFLVLSIFPVMRLLNFTRADLGFLPSQLFFKQLLKGFGLGFLTLIPVFILLTVLGINVIDETQPWTLFWIGKKVTLELLLALLIGFFEETLFRGVLLTALRKVFPVAGAIAISAVYYAGLHFLDSKTDIPAHALTLFSGFSLLGDALLNMLNPDILSAFFALLMVGIYLGLLKSTAKGSLGLCIGCHASWVWQIKLNKSFFNTDFTNAYAPLVSEYDGVIGPLVSIWLMLAVVVFIRYRRLNNAGFN